MDTIDGKIVRTRSEWLTLTIKLLKRSLFTLSLTALVTVGAVIEYLSKPTIDILIANTITLDKSSEILKNYEKILSSKPKTPVIYSDAMPMKQYLETQIQKIDLIKKKDNELKPIIPTIGMPKPVKMYRVSPSGQLLDGSPLL